MMKLIQYCVSVLCVASYTASFYTNGELLHMSRQHMIQKRQDLNQENCDMVVRDEACINGLYQDVVTVYERCNDSSIITYFQVICTPDFMGGYCVSDTMSMLQRNITTYCTGINSTCSQDCRDLLIRTRNELGCCIHTIYNDSTISRYYNPAPYAYSLWSSCKVEPVTQECPLSTIRLTPTQIDPSCNNNQTAALQLELSTGCKLNYRQAIQNRLSVLESCQNYSTPLTEFLFCTANRLGRYCASIQRSTLSQLYTEAFESCQNTNICNPRCIGSLNNITNTVGCCFNDWYNSTDSPRDWLSYEFWSRCNLTSPGHCELRFTDDLSQDNNTTETSTNDSYNLITTLPQDNNTIETSMNDSYYLITQDNNTIETSTDESNNLITPRELPPIVDHSSNNILNIIVIACSVLVMGTAITIVGICTLKAICKRKSETSSQHHEQEQRTGEADEEEHVYDYIKEHDEDVQVEENVAYSVISRQQNQ